MNTREKKRKKKKRQYSLLENLQYEEKYKIIITIKIRYMKK